VGTKNALPPQRDAPTLYSPSRCQHWLPRSVTPMRQGPGPGDVNSVPRKWVYSTNISTARTASTTARPRLRTKTAFSPIVHGGGRSRRLPGLLWLRSTLCSSGSLRSLGPTVAPSTYGPPPAWVSYPWTGDSRRSLAILALQVGSGGPCRWIGFRLHCTGTRGCACFLGGRLTHHLPPPPHTHRTGAPAFSIPGEVCTILRSPTSGTCERGLSRGWHSPIRWPLDLCDSTGPLEHGPRLGIALPSSMYAHVGLARIHCGVLSLVGSYPYGTGCEPVTLHIHPAPQHVVEASYVCRAVKELFVLLRRINSR
jgi:hypothetical protein